VSHPARPTILVVTASAPGRVDPHVAMVTPLLEAAGARVRLLEADRYPDGFPLTVDVDAGDVRAVDSASEAFAFSELDAVWIRDVAVAAYLPGDLAPEHHAACTVLAEAALGAALEMLPERVFVLDRLHTMQACPRKARLLQLARQSGLVTPRTLVTNDPDAARAFARSCEGGAIVKMISSAHVLVGDRDVIYTRAFDPDEDTAGLAISPMLFQERVPKSLELRVTVVGRRMFTASIDARGSSLGADDWRQDRALDARFQPYALPPEVEAALTRLIDQLGLNFATADFIVTPAGDVVFLEINTISGYAFAERAGLPISAAIADLLLGRAPRRG
jgi:glutathione synthase/RimK-type ligase-like ATP-grasp enzyme